MAVAGVDSCSSSPRRTCGLETARARARPAGVAFARGRDLQPAARAAALRALQTGEVGDLREAIRDRWHQPYPRAARARPPGGARARSSRGTRHLPQRRRAVGRGPERRRTPRPRRRACSRPSIAGSAWRVPSEHLKGASTMRCFSLRCHLCHTSFPAGPLWVCDRCLGPLEVAYDYDAIAARDLARADREPAARTCGATASCCRSTASRGRACTRASRRSSRADGWPPARRARALREGRLGQPSDLFVQGSRRLGRRDAGGRARLHGVRAARRPAISRTASPPTRRALGLDCYVFIPDDLEAGQGAGAAIYRPRMVAVRGNYDDVNRLCTQIADKYGWAFVNINLRAVLRRRRQDLRLRDRRAARLDASRSTSSSPVAGGTILPKILKGFEELRELGLVDGDVPAIYAAQAAGCAPVVARARRRPRHPRAGRSRTRSRSRSRSATRPTASTCCSAVRETGGSGAMVDRRRDRRRHPAAGRDRRHLHRARRRHDHRRDEAS